MTYATLPLTDKAMISEVISWLRNNAGDMNDYGIVRISGQTTKSGGFSAMALAKRDSEGKPYISDLAVNAVWQDDVEFQRHDLKNYINEIQPWQYWCKV